MACSRASKIFCLCPLIVGSFVAATTAGDSLDERRQRLESMSDAEKHALLKKKREFDNLTRSEKQRLRDFYQRLQENSDRERLQKILTRYDEWLMSLKPGQKAQLLELPADQRIARIKEIQQEQDTQRFRMLVRGHLKEDDLQAIRKWLDEFVLEHEDEILAALPKDRFGPFIEAYNSKRDRRNLPFVMFRPNLPNIPLPTAEDEQRLEQLISPEARKSLSSLGSDEKRSQVLQSWIRAAWFRPPPVDRKELDEFAAKTLDQENRERLENYPRDRMYRELRGLYYKERFRQMAAENGGWQFPGPPPSSHQPRGPRFGPGPNRPGSWPGQSKGPPQHRGGRRAMPDDNLPRDNPRRDDSPGAQDAPREPLKAPKKDQ
jgi:hypothetical protein